MFPFPAPSAAGRTVRRTLAALAALAALAGCSVFKDKEPPPACPGVSIDRDTARVTQFRHGLGRDITDIVMETDLMGYSGDCSVDKKKNQVLMHLSMSFKSHLGPAAAPGDEDGIRHGSFKYFIALPDFFPHPAGKQVFAVDVAFPPNVNELTYRDEQIDLLIPLTKGMTSKDVRVYLGMQLDGEQLKYNRKNPPK